MTGSKNVRQARRAMAGGCAYLQARTWPIFICLMTSCRSACLAVASLGFACLCWGQIGVGDSDAKCGGEGYRFWSHTFVVNSFIPGPQGGPEVAVGSDNGFVNRYFGLLDEDKEYLWRFFDRRCIAYGRERLSLGFKRIASTPQGQFVALSPGIGLPCQRFDLRGQQVGQPILAWPEEFWGGPLGRAGGYDLEDVDIAASKAGFLVISVEYHLPGRPLGHCVRVIRFHSLRYNGTTLARGLICCGRFEDLVEASMADDGSFVTVSTEYISGPGGIDGIPTTADRVVWVRLFGPDGKLKREPFFPHETPRIGKHQSTAQVAMDSKGNLVVAWIAWDAYEAELGTAALLRRFDSEGQPLTEPFFLQYSPGDSQTPEDVVCDAEGNFVVIWTQGRGGLLAQRFLADGSRFGHPFQVWHRPWNSRCGTWTVGLSRPKADMNDAGRIVVTWHSCYGRDYWEGHDWSEVVARALDFWAPEFIRGDANGDSEVDMEDVLVILNYLFSPNSPPPYHPDACDTNDSGRINVADVIHLLRYLFTDKVKKLPHPFPYWGFDTTRDEL